MPGDVIYVELALDFEPTVQRALLAQPDHALRFVVLPLQNKATVLLVPSHQGNWCTEVLAALTGCAMKTLLCLHAMLFAK